MTVIGADGENHGDPLARTTATAPVRAAAGATPGTAAGTMAGHDELSGLIRRARRRAKLSQRELAHDLGVSQSAVAKWETGRTEPSARMLTRILGLAGLHLVAVADDGKRVRPMNSVAARDAAHRRYPAHTFVWSEGWWAPEGAETTAWLGEILCRSADLALPRVRYSRSWQPARPPTVADLSDHPTWAELVAEASEGWQPRRHNPTLIPDWALQDTKKSRNRRPGDHRRAVRSDDCGDDCGNDRGNDQGDDQRDA